MKISLNNNLDLQCGNIVEHCPGPENISFGAGTLIKQTGDELWIVKFFDGREFEMISDALKKIRCPLTEEHFSCRIKE